MLLKLAISLKHRSHSHLSSKAIGSKVPAYRGRRRGSNYKDKPAPGTHQSVFKRKGNDTRLPYPTIIIKTLIRMWPSASFAARVCAGVALAMSLSLGAGRREYKDPDKMNSDISLWIDERQVRMFSGISMQVFAIVNGNISPYILEPNFSHKLPIIPSEVGYVNFTWRSKKKYFYNFDTLTSSDPKVLKPPLLSIKTQGRVPKLPKEFSIFLPCMGNVSGVATFEIGLVLKNGRGTPLKGTPLRLNLKKECAQRGPDPECDKKCANQGWCNSEKICQCPEGYMGQHCRTALCYPQCMNGGNCTAPGVCSCPPGYQGRHCEGGQTKNYCLL
ncbi:unnamed protein product, partial [Brenthis ino]